MKFWDGLKQEMQNHFQRKKEEKELVERIKLEAEAQRLVTLEVELRKNSLEVAISKAKKDAAKLSGMQKLRAENRVRNLQKQDAGTHGNFLSKLGEYTQRNIAKTEERLKRTEEMRQVASEIKKTPVQNIQRKPFSPTRL